MATLVLQAAGAYLGGLFGAVGATVGTAAGALAGYVLDRALINGSQHIQGARLSAMQPLTGEDGANLARAYGTVRLGGTLIWATRFEEASKTERSGAKGGPKVTTYSYFANFVVAVCEGEIAHIRRIWADGKELDRSEFDIRIYKGTSDQLPDPLIEAKQGTGNTPAYRGTAYVVFDRFPLENFGNRIPQVQFEVIRTLGGIEKNIKAVTLIPGSTEFGLSPTAVVQTIRQGESTVANRHVLNADTDFESSLDELQALCPNLERVALVVAWFGDDLRAASCTIMPGVASLSAGIDDHWQVAGLTRSAARLVSLDNGSRAFGGTPDDASVIAAIQNIKARGLQVTLYPFILMDIPAGNLLASPYGGTSQPAYPWRGDMSCMPAPGQGGTVDASATAASQVTAFLGSAQPAMFGNSGTNVTFSGGNDFGYRRMILHYAKLATLAGGVDGFLIGSELKGLTRVRGLSHSFPFVDGLCALAADVRTILGASTKLTYAADWSEYGGYVPQAAPTNLYFNLDSLWAHPAINAIGIDNYMPLSDWRDGHWDGSNPDGATCPSDPIALQTAINKGEGFDWYYADFAARNAGTRTAISDGLAGKHWVYRFKDIQGWWENPHNNRIAGVEQGVPTAWVPKSKPVWFTELGCPAIDKAANQPNVFPDPKSSASASPYFSDGGRDDLIQNCFLEAHFGHWASAANPASNVYSGKMVDVGNTYLWAWDARPFPAFPLTQTVWADGNNWLTGHWLNGRLSGLPLSKLVSSLLTEHGFTDFDCTQIDGFVTGYALSDQTNAREALQSVLGLYRVDASEKNGQLMLTSRDRATIGANIVADIALGENDAPPTLKLEEPNLVAQEMTLHFRDGLRDHQTASVSSRATVGKPAIDGLDLPVVLDPGAAETQLRMVHRQRLAMRSTVSFRSSWRDAALAPGDLVKLDASAPEVYRVNKITDAVHREIEAEMAVSGRPPATRSSIGSSVTPRASVSGQPWHMFMDLPFLPVSASETSGLRLAAWSKPWTPVVALESPDTSGFTQRVTLPEKAIYGTLTTALPAGSSGRWNKQSSLTIQLAEGSMQSSADILVLNGGNVAAIKSLSGAWEIVQYSQATEVSPSVWTLSKLLRGQLGTTDAMLAGSAIGAEFILLDSAVKNCGLTSTETELAQNWKIGPSGKDITDRYFASDTVPPAKRALLSFAPVHLEARQSQSGDIICTWLRCGNRDGDGWDNPDIPLPESAESYRIRVLTLLGAVLREVTVTNPTWTYPAALRTADLGTSNFILEVSQISASGLPGLPTQLTVTIM